MNDYTITKTQSTSLIPLPIAIGINRGLGGRSLKYKQMKHISTLLIAFAFTITSCANHANKQEDQTPIVSVKATPVKYGDIENSISLNGKTIYLKKNVVASPISGYILKVHIKFGDKVQKNDVLYEIETKESRALANANSVAGGIIKVFAPSTGILNELTVNNSGGYVVEGYALCSIVENRNVMVQVNVPFEYNSLLKPGIVCKLFLTDKTAINGVIYQILPVIDEVNQTQNVLIKPVSNRQLPENLNLTVQMLQTKHTRICIVPKDAVMTNENQTEFWVMKIVNGNLALKIDVKKGIENDNSIEVLSTDLKNNDLVITEGAYGLADSTIVKMEK